MYFINDTFTSDSSFPIERTCRQQSRPWLLVSSDTWSRDSWRRWRARQPDCGQAPPRSARASPSPQLVPAQLEESTAAHSTGATRIWWPRSDRPCGAPGQTCYRWEGQRETHTAPGVKIYRQNEPRLSSDANVEKTINLDGTGKCSTFDGQTKVSLEGSESRTIPFKWIKQKVLIDVNSDA